jgi:hypothetical protein
MVELMLKIPGVGSTKVTVGVIIFVSVENVNTLLAVILEVFICCVDTNPFI